MFIFIKSRPEFKMGHARSKTRLVGQFSEKQCVHTRRHSLDPVFIKLCQNVHLYEIYARIKNGSCQLKKLGHKVNANIKKPVYTLEGIVLIQAS